MSTLNNQRPERTERHVYGNYNIIMANARNVSLHYKLTLCNRIVKFRIFLAYNLLYTILQSEF